MQYSSYLKTEHWKNIREEKLLKNPICQVCDSQRGIHVHHKRYKDAWGKSILFRERLADLITLCGSCHRLTHVYLGINVKKINKKILRIKRLLSLGSAKNKAFWVASQDNNLFIALAHPYGK